MNRFKREGLVPMPGQDLLVRCFLDGRTEVGTAVMGKRSFVVDRFDVVSHFPSGTFPDTYYCSDHGITWLYAGEPLPATWK